MALIFLDYDLRKASNYQPLYDEFKRSGAFGCWSPRGASNVSIRVHLLRHYFEQFSDSDDGLSVVEATDRATYNAKRTPKDLS